MSLLTGFDCLKFQDLAGGGGEVVSAHNSRVLSLSDSFLRACRGLVVWAAFNCTYQAYKAYQGCVKIGPDARELALWVYSKYWTTNPIGGTNGFTYSIVGANNTTNFVGYTIGTVYPIGGNNGTTYPTGRANGKTYPVGGINGTQRVKKLGNKSDEKCS